MKHQQLKVLEAVEKAAWKAKMNGSEAEISTVFGQEGSLELAWRETAEACRAYREQHGLLGLTWKQIAGKGQ
jgi:hypothetical protein